MMEWLLWGILPYAVLVIFIGGHLIRYQYDQLGWTVKSSEFLSKKDLRYGILLLHWGIIFVLIGHVLGLIVPKGVYDALGITKDAYHYLAIGAGIPAGIAALIGLLLLVRRRLTNPKVKQTTSKADTVALLALLVVVGSGLSATFMNIDSQGFDYRTTISPWFRGLFYLNVQPELMTEVPVWFKTHVLAAFAFFAIWPFTRMVHVFSLPFMYLTRSPMIFRKKRKNNAA
ncbi:respiratory nitrate reductase subunit gamma [Salisediminibacterium selenitireducens]|uniref:Respiratory nitrate reductase, gamma subunit n=1 Tax=Bacillus selenitireducens (strain ATCC 700615 / DSM 15326 / MLS10) TaxID=439292 RepID=D6XSM1_BACIE|nr:respiratory nitrate reductase subunit gamma [Salisediminibacterium selenitireducens]ADH98807.1 respiratory nitrate reductase, gamma subunit [[Bacillus] selenitireducens MLS10]